VQEAKVVNTSLSRVREAALTRGCPAPDEQAVRAFFTVQIEASKSIQRRTVAVSSIASKESRSSLDEQLRPALAQIGERMAWLIVELRAVQGGKHCEPKVVAEQTAAALDGHGLSAAELSSIADALIALTNR
jgi:hypothetical protein